MAKAGNLRFSKFTNLFGCYWVLGYTLYLCSMKSASALAYPCYRGPTLRGSNHEIDRLRLSVVGRVETVEYNESQRYAIGSK